MGATFKNWSTAVKFQPDQVLYPESEEEVIAIVKRCAERGQQPRVVGAGHSFTPLVQTRSILISLDKLSGLEIVGRFHDLRLFAYPCPSKPDQR